MIERHKRRRRRVRTAVLAEFRWTKSQAMFELPLDWADGTGMGPGLVGYLLTHLLTVSHCCGSPPFNNQSIGSFFFVNTSRVEVKVLVIDTVCGYCCQCEVDDNRWLSGVRVFHNVSFC